MDLKPRHALAGLQAGVLGALFTILWLMGCSRYLRRSAWDIPNLFATSFYGAAAYQQQYLRTSWTGVAMIVAIGGLGGALWGIVCRENRPPLLPLVGAAVGLGLYFVSFDVIWKQINPMIPLYAPLRQVQVGYLIWGLALSRSPRFARAISVSTSAAAR
ncbi:MAG TPA: hypothetical protein VKB79_22240 [Bryobacteraceae bacterium]|nr:hypothetical protein [Bryobacteraceae bacterium]